MCKLYHKNMFLCKYKTYANANSKKKLIGKDDLISLRFETFSSIFSKFNFDISIKTFFEFSNGFNSQIVQFKSFKSFYF